MKIRYKKLTDAMKRYYRNRRSGNEWDKQADLDYIGKCAPKSLEFLEASAGTFLATWTGGEMTIHNEDDYWLWKTYARKSNGQWTQYRDICGDAIKPKVLQ